MRSVLGFAGIGLVLIVAGVPATRAEDGRSKSPAQLDPDYQICRVEGDKSDCIQFKKDCVAGGVVRQADEDARSCDPATPSSCAALEQVVERTVRKLEALPKNQRSINSRARPCDGFTLIDPDHAIAACFDTQPKGSRELYRLFAYMTGLCE